MRVSELCERSAVPLSTVKFYIREGLLPPGTRTGANQATYDERHLERLTLIRALRDVCGLGVDPIRRVLVALDAPDGEPGPIRTALHAMEPAPPERSQEDEAAFRATLDEVTDFLDGLDWTLPGRHAEYAEQLAEALLHLRRIVMPEIPVEVLAPYARAAWALSEVEYHNEPDGQRIRPRRGDDLAHPSRMAILGILLMEPILLSMRRYALNARGTRHWESLPVPGVDAIRDPEA